MSLTMKRFSLKSSLSTTTGNEADIFDNDQDNESTSPAKIAKTSSDIPSFFTPSTRTKPAIATTGAAKPKSKKATAKST